MTFDDALAQAKAAFSPSTALDYLRRQYVAFRGLGTTLVGMMHEASQMAVFAARNGDTAQAARLKARIRDIGQLAAFHQSVMNKMDDVLSAAGVDVAGLGILPIVPIAAIATATAVVAAVLYLTFHVSDQRRALDLEYEAMQNVAAGKMTPEQAAAYVKAANAAATASASGGFGSQVSKAALGLGVLLAVFYLAPVIVPALKRGGSRG